VEVAEEGLWSSVVGGVASVVMDSPEEQASEQFRSVGRKRIQDRFAEGYTAELDFCSGRLETGFGLGEQATEHDAGEWTSGFMHPEGLIIDGPENVDPEAFSVTVSANQGLQVQLMCSRQAKQLAQAFIDDRELPQVNALVSQVIQGEQTIELDRQVVNCPVALVFRPSEQAADAAFRFRYQKETAPLIPEERTDPQCPGGASRK
jgi:hypothetical protein